jgi:hypothetical protein
MLLAYKTKNHMRIALKYMGERHRKREKPDIISVCHSFKPEVIEKECSCTPGPKRFQTIHVKTIPFGKRYFECDPCKPKCNPPLAKTASLEELRNHYRFQCCPKCNV